MAAGEPGRPGPDQGAASLRRLLLQAVDDDSVRGQALAAVMGSRVLVPTWPHSPESVRTLTNSDGEQAMPLFTSWDALQSAAQRFGWVGADGSVNHRELEGADVLRSALSNALHFVVFDICEEHSIEFAHEEIAHTLGAQLGVRVAATTAACAEAPAVQRAEAVAEPVRQPAAPIERSTGLIAPVIEESVSPRVGRGVRPDPRAEPSTAKPLGAVAVARVAVPVSAVRAGQAAQRLSRPERAQTPGAFEAPQPAPRPPTPQPFAAVQPKRTTVRREAPQAPAAFEAAAAVVMMPSVSVSVSPPELPPMEGTPDFGFARAPALEQNVAFAVASDEPEANPAALEAAAMVAQAAKLANDSATKQAAAEVTAMLTEMTVKGGVEEDKPNAVQAAARTLAAMFMGGEVNAAAPASDARKTLRRDKPARAGAAAVAPQPAQEDARDEAHALEAREAPLEDALLARIAEGLRKYPEVEWACALSDEADQPVIGVRIDPSFTANAREIQNAIVRAGAAHDVRLSVLLLNEPQQMKDVRKRGDVFFPWRKRPKR